jgi:hypothetical protein
METSILGLMFGDDLRHERVDGKSVAGETDCRFRHFAEAHRAEALERRDPSIRCRRHDCAQNALRNLAGMVFFEMIALDRLRPGTEAGDREDAIVGGGIDDDRRDAREIHIFRLHDSQSNARRDACIDRIATHLQNPKASLGCEVLASSDHVARSHDGRAMGLHDLLLILHRKA